MFSRSESEDIAKECLLSVESIVKMNRLKKVGSFYSYGSFDFERINTVENLRVMVHPLSYDSERDNFNFEKTRDDLIKNSQDLILIGLSTMEGEETKRQIDKLRKGSPNMPRLLYFTKYSMATPVQPTDREFTLAIENQFHPKNVTVCGAEIIFTLSGGLSRLGCVNGTYKRLTAKFPTVLDIENSWINDYRNFD